MFLFRLIFDSFDDAPGSIASQLSRFVIFSSFFLLFYISFSSSCRRIYKYSDCVCFFLLSRCGCLFILDDVLDFCVRIKQTGERANARASECMCAWVRESTLLRIREFSHIWKVCCSWYFFFFTLAELMSENTKDKRCQACVFSIDNAPNVCISRVSAVHTLNRIKRPIPPTHTCASIFFSKPAIRESVFSLFEHIASDAPCLFMWEMKKIARGRNFLSRWVLVNDEKC